MESNRRTFIKKTAYTTTGIGLASIVPSEVWGAKTAPSDKINVGLIGCRNMGFGDLQQQLKTTEVNCAALCDVDDTVLNKKAAEIKDKYNQSPQLYKDFRKLLEQKDIDAVIIGTPDHWHCLMMVSALESGKDVYVEKPLGNSIEECNIMVRAAKKHKQIVQVGQQQRSGFIFQKAMELIKTGKIGTLRKVNIWANFEYGVGPQIVPDGPVPDGVDYDMWLGPAPKRPFNTNRLHGSWRHFWDYGGGLASDWGVHLVDMGLWAKDITTAPATIMTYGANTFPEKRARETFDTMTISYPKSDFVINYDLTAGLQHGPWDMPYGIAFIGDSATIVTDRIKMTVYPEYDNQAKKLKTEEYKFTEGKESHDLHARNFLDCIKSRQAPVCPPELGRAAALHVHMANIAARVGEPVLLWDDTKNSFTNSDAANRLIVPGYRKPWELPKY
jgi:predicted dehydrogenase